jgi:hypothetical protein
MKKITLFAFIAVLLAAGPAVRLTAASEPAAPAASQSIATDEVKDATAEAEQKIIPLAKVDASRAVTAERLYGLGGFWLLIALAIFLIRYQVRDDEKLYREGYYDKDIK